jgi:hypothetical protein
MPTDACQFFYDCKKCGERLKPLAGAAYFAPTVLLPARQCRPEAKVIAAAELAREAIKPEALTNVSFGRHLTDSSRISNHFTTSLKEAAN